MPLEKPKTDQPTTKPPQEDRATIESNLNQAANDLLAQLPDHAGQLVHSLAKQYQMPLWQYTSGILLAVHLEGRLSEFRVDPAWKDGLKTKQLKCQNPACGKLFTPRRINQLYCSNACGLACTAPISKRKVIRDDLVSAKPTMFKPKSSTSAGWTSEAAVA